MESKENLRNCVLCRKDFEVTEPGRMKILRREKKGEKCVWVCRECAPKVKIS